MYISVKIMLDNSQIDEVLNFFFHTVTVMLAFTLYKIIIF